MKYRTLFSGSYKQSLITGYINTILQILVGLVMTPYILSFISRSEFGVYTVIGDTFALFSILDFGFTGALNTLTARETQNTKQINLLSSTTYTLQFMLGIIGAVLGILLSFVFPYFFEVGDISKSEISIMVLIFAIGFFFSMITRTYSSLLIAHRKIHQDNLIRMALFIIRTLVIVLLLNLNLKLISLAISILFAQVLTAIITRYRVKKTLPHIKIKLFEFDKNAVKKLFNLGIWFTVGTISVLLVERFDKIVTGKIISLEIVTILVVTGKLFDITKSLVYQITDNYRPYFGKIIGDNLMDLAIQKFKEISTISLGITTTVGTLIILINQQFVSFWLDNSYYGGDLLCWALLGNLFYYCWKLPYRAFLTANLVVKEQSIVGIVEGVFNLLTSIILGKLYGVIGIVAGTFITGFVLQFTYYAYLMKVKVQLSINSYLWANLKNFLFLVLLSTLAYLIAGKVSNQPLFSVSSIITKLLFLVTALILFYAMNKRMINAIIKTLVVRKSKSATY